MEKLCAHRCGSRTDRRQGVQCVSCAASVTHRPVGLPGCHSVGNSSGWAVLLSEGGILWEAGGGAGQTAESALSGARLPPADGLRVGINQDHTISVRAHSLLCVKLICTINK